MSLAAAALNASTAWWSHASFVFELAIEIATALGGGVGVSWPGTPVPVGSPPRLPMNWPATATTKNTTARPSASASQFERTPCPPGRNAMRASSLPLARASGPGPRLPFGGEQVVQSCCGAAPGVHDVLQPRDGFVRFLGRVLGTGDVHGIAFDLEIPAGASFPADRRWS